MSNLKDELVKLGAERKDLREDIRPILAALNKRPKTAAPSIASNIKEYLSEAVENAVDELTRIGSSASTGTANKRFRYVLYGRKGSGRENEFTISVHFPEIRITDEGTDELHYIVSSSEVGNLAKKEKIAEGSMWMSNPSTIGRQIASIIERNAPMTV